MLRSMTGYGTGEATLGKGRLVVEARAVNGRFLDARVRMPPELADQASAAEEVVRARLERGRVEVTGRLEGDPLGGPTLDRVRARAAFAELCALRDELRPDEPVPLSLLATVPDLFSAAAAPRPEQSRAAVVEATRGACEALSKMRVREGAALEADLCTRLARVRDTLEQLVERVPDLLAAHHTRLRERVERLLADTDVKLDPGRLEHEIALFADRSDVAEETTRLASHCDQFAELIASEEPAVGRRLDFLLQEMGREVNTIGSKSSDVETARRVIDLKAELERMREQVQNVL